MASQGNGSFFIPGSEPPSTGPTASEEAVLKNLRESVQRVAAPYRDALIAAAQSFVSQGRAGQAIGFTAMPGYQPLRVEWTHLHYRFELVFQWGGPTKDAVLLQRLKMNAHTGYPLWQSANVSLYFSEDRLVNVHLSHERDPLNITGWQELQDLVGSWTEGSSWYPDSFCQWNWEMRRAGAQVPFFQLQASNARVSGPAIFLYVSMNAAKNQFSGFYQGQVGWSNTQVRQPCRAPDGRLLGETLELPIDSYVASLGAALAMIPRQSGNSR
jgi:hypothetical protein